MGEIRLARDYFLLCLSGVYLFAFTSLYSQIPGLYGDKGILPVRMLLKRDSKSLEQCIAEKPTILWFASEIGLDSQRMMDLVCLAGIIISFLCLLSHRIRDTIAFALLWISYFSLYQVGQTFLWFQWDILLLEAGFIAILVAPLNLFRWKSLSYYPHDAINLWLIRWLLFRLMFASGVVKLTSLCPTWWGLTALNHHFQSQCIPTPFSWFAHNLPEWFLKLGVVGAFLVEIPIPLLFFSPVRTLRVFSFYSQLTELSPDTLKLRTSQHALHTTAEQLSHAYVNLSLEMVLFQVMIIITGNYNFFNVLTLALCISLLDDEHIVNYHSGPIEVVVKVEHPSMLHFIPRMIKKAFVIIVYLALIYWTVALFSLQLKPNFTIQSKIAFTAKDFNKALEKVVELTMWIGAISLFLTILGALYKSFYYESGFVRKFRTILGCLVFGIIAFFMFGISLVPHTVLDKGAHAKIWPVLRQWHDSVDRYQLTNSYGLFRRMTGVGGRPELIIEGSNFASSTGWQEYEFLYKPGRLDTCSPFVAPHQPRLDWQMWFASLSPYKSNPWFIMFMYRLLHNQKEVLGLINHNPFPQQPPKFVRATLYTYKFAPFKPKKKAKNPHHWWTRKKVSEYMPSFSKENKTVIEYLRTQGLLEKKKAAPSFSKNYILKNIIDFIRTYVSYLTGPTLLWSLFFTALTIRSLSGFDPAPTRVYC